MWAIYGWGVTRGGNAKTPPLLTGFFAVLWIERTPLTKYEKDSELLLEISTTTSKALGVFSSTVKTRCQSYDRNRIDGNERKTDLH